MNVFTLIIAHFYFNIANDSECQYGRKKFMKVTKVYGKKMLSGMRVEDEG